MRNVVRLDMNSALKVFAVFYAMVGLYVASKAAIHGDESVLCPFGFAFPLLTFYIYLTVHLPNPATWVTGGIILMTTVFYALAGLFSGTVIVLAYNLVARKWPLVRAEFAPEEQVRMVSAVADLSAAAAIESGAGGSGPQTADQPDHPA
jgi:hypothetical protein